MTAVEERRTGRWHACWPYAVLIVSVLIQHSITLLAPIDYGYADLRVYIRGAEELFTGNLYTFGVEGFSPDALGFTYPPFAALVFTPLSWLPFGAAAVVMTLLNISLAYVVVRLSLALFPVTVPHRRIVLFTAAALWAEPVRLTTDYGQINLVLVTLILLAAYLGRNIASGALVGVAAGIKLTPAVSGLYFLAVKRYTAAAWSAVAFAATVAVVLVLAPSETREYFGTLLGDTDRIGPTSNVVNQSLRGMLSRFAGDDVGSGPMWIAAVLVAAALAVAAVAATRHHDRLVILLIVQLFALLASPISWAHHWVWTVPVVLWLALGPLRSWRPARILAWLWGIYLVLGCNIFEITATAMGTAEGDIVFGLLTSPEALLTIATLIACALSKRYAREENLRTAPSGVRDSGSRGSDEPARRSPSDIHR